MKWKIKSTKRMKKDEKDLNNNNNKEKENDIDWLKSNMKKSWKKKSNE